MKRNTLTLLTAAALLLALPAHAQQYTLRFHSAGHIVHTATAGGTNSLTFSDGNATLSADGTSWSSALTAIDSLTFSLESSSADAVTIVWNGSSVEIENPFADLGVTVTADGSRVTAASSTTSLEVPFILSGSSDDGSLTLSAAKKVSFTLDNLSLSSASGPAIDISGGKKTTITLVGSSTLADAAGGSHKGALQSKGDLVFRGEGSLAVTGNTRHGIRTKEDFALLSGTLAVTSNGMVVLVASGSGYEPDYSNAIKVGGIAEFSGGTLTATCPASNAGGKAISCDSNVTISGGTLTLAAAGSCARYLDSNGTYDSYSSACLKADGDILISGGTIAATAGGRAIACDGAYTQTGGSVTASTSAAGFGTQPYGNSSSYFSDGFAPTCLKADGDITFIAGTFFGTSTGKAGRGIRGKGTLTVGREGDNDSLLVVYVTTSGAPFLSSSSSTYWRGLPKGIKIEGNITVNSGHLQSYCSQTSSGGGGWGGGGGRTGNGEAIESKDSIFINGGDVEANALDDAINAASYIRFNGGRTWAYARNNDAIDCNGTHIDINGGLVIAQGSEVAIDDNGDHGGRLYITGGTIVLLGGNMGTTEATPSVSNQKSLTIGSSGGGGWGGSSINVANGLCFKDSDGNEVLTFKAPAVTGNGFVTNTTTGGTQSTLTSRRVFISSPDIQSGTYRYYTSPTISGGTHWHGLYDGTTVTTSGNGTQITAQ